MPDERMNHGDAVLAVESAIALVDGQKGELLYRGHSIHDIAEELSFPQTVFLLWRARLPSAEESLAFGDELATLRGLPDAVLELLMLTPTYAHPTATLRTAVSMLACMDPDQDDTGPEGNEMKAKKLLAQLPTIVAAHHRIRQELEPIAPSAKLSHAANYLHMLNGGTPDEQSVRALSVGMNLYAEHELNASTFTARIVVGTLSDLYSAVVAAISALKGPLHGGAVDDVMRMLQRVGSESRVARYLDMILSEGLRVPGFGHPVYQFEDPRAAHMKAVLEKLGGEADRWAGLVDELAAYMFERRSLLPNVDLYAAPVLYQLGFPVELFTSVIASAQIAGWAAHILEQYGNNRMFRPRTEYIGPRL
ncbi:MAG: citrate synthase [Chloroflexota bacterium]|nr:citrate synthase [Chloroflexota bacterium]